MVLYQRRSETAIRSWLQLGLKSFRYSPSGGFESPQLHQVYFQETGLVLLPIGKGPDGYRPLKKASWPGSGKPPAASQPTAGSQQPVDGGRTHPAELSFRRGIDPLLTMLPEYLDHLRNKGL
jgi:hypothetical protein